MIDHLRHISITHLMKEFLKPFAWHLLTMAVLATAIAYFIDGKMATRPNKEGAVGSTYAMMQALYLGGILAPTLIALVAGWRVSLLKPLLIAASLIAYLFGGYLIAVLITAFLVTVAYFIASKARQITAYYFV
jgi:hypothetical protein